MFSGFELIACCLYFVAGIAGAQAEKVVSEEIKDHESFRRDRNVYNAEQSRRSIVDDDKWNVAHLRDTDFSQRRSGCKEETFAEKALRYRKALKNDPALVQFVSAAEIEVDDEEKAGNVCYMPEAIERTFKFHNKSSRAGKVEAKKANVETATVHDGKDKEVKKDLRRKPSEYQFSSIEYYDDVPTFDVGVCPDSAVEVILEIEHIRNYDVECELLVEWRSLD